MKNTNNSCMCWTWIAVDLTLAAIDLTYHQSIRRRLHQYLSECSKAKHRYFFFTSLRWSNNTGYRIRSTRKNNVPYRGIFIEPALMEFSASKIKGYEIWSFDGNHIPPGLRFPPSRMLDVYQSFRITCCLHLREERRGCSLPNTKTVSSSDTLLVSIYQITNHHFS
jgi:hypothetical protein